MIPTEVLIKIEINIDIESKLEVTEDIKGKQK